MEVTDVFQVFLISRDLSIVIQIDMFRDWNSHKDKNNLEKGGETKQVK